MFALSLEKLLVLANDEDRVDQPDRFARIMSIVRIQDTERTYALQLLCDTSYVTLYSSILTECPELHNFDRTSSLFCEPQNGHE